MSQNSASQFGSGSGGQKTPSTPARGSKASKAGNNETPSTALTSITKVNGSVSQPKQSIGFPGYSRESVFNSKAGASTGSPAAIRPGISGIDDPFFASKYLGSNLSATAANFTPSNLAELNATSVPEIDGLNGFKTNIVLYYPNEVVALSQQPFTREIDPAVDGRCVTRYLRISGISALDFEEELSQQGPIGTLKQTSLIEKIIGIKKFESTGHYHLRFDHVDDALAIRNLIEANIDGLNPIWSVQFTKAVEYHKNGALDSPYWSPAEAEVRIIFTCLDAMLLTNNDALNAYAVKLATEVGEVVAIRGEGCIGNEAYFHVELKSITAADALVRKYGVHVKSQVYPCWARVMHFDPANDPLATSLPGFLSMTSKRFADSARFRDNGMNMVIPEDILAGRDVRTTVMLRNIPNKLQAFEFKRLLDATSFGQYDFSYLRVDFNNQCNVGYGFINFLKAEHILPFFYMIAGKRWGLYNSDKVARICYATIQGKDCLVEKFRNSGVMTQWTPFRPKLYYSEDDMPGEEIGREMGFPEPNNYTKLRRSLDNTKSVGLFPPGSVGNNRRGNRSRLSQFDRGTHHAIAEELELSMTGMHGALPPYGSLIHTPSHFRASNNLSNVFGARTPSNGVGSLKIAGPFDDTGSLYDAGPSRNGGRSRNHDLGFEFI